MKFLFLVPIIAFADTSVTLNKQQLGIAQEQIQQSGKQAIAKAGQSSKELSTIKLNQLDLKPIESEISQAQPIFKKVKPLANKLPDGEKYYLYSESIVSDSTFTQNEKPLDINETISNYNALIKNAKTKIGDERLLIFISSSMPKKTIVNLTFRNFNVGLC